MLDVPKSAVDSSGLPLPSYSSSSLVAKSRLNFFFHSHGLDMTEIVG
jgi:hypothetical protein